MAERIAIGFVNFPAVDGEEYDEPEVRPYLAVLERLQERLVPFMNSKGITLELFVEVADGVRGYVRPQECAASGAGHSDGPHGPHGEVQCAYCGQSPSAGVPADPAVERVHIGSVVLPGISGEEYDDPEFVERPGVLELLQERLVRNGTDCNLDVFVELPDGVGGPDHG